MFVPRHRYFNARFKKQSPIGILALTFFLVSLSATTFAVLLFQSKDTQPQHKVSLEVEGNIPTALGSVTLFVPVTPLEAGSSLSGDKIKEIYRSPHNVPPDAIRDRNEMKGLFAARTLDPEVPITRGMLTTVFTQNSLPVTVGNRAVTIKVDPETSVDGFVVPGSLVDVVLTYLEGDETVSKFLVQRARVISIGGSTQPTYPSPIAHKQPLSTTATLDVSPEKAMEILTSTHLGRISLILRSQEDPKIFHNSPPKKRPVQDNICGTMRMAEMSYAIPCDPSRPTELVD